ncbi:MAG TPA: glutathione S-transferase family protein [Candidatus Dormibacteraeota bacterium]|nr:glutathione S-transferase family protein [Candidatus Dormibacteraeota bacterium]
MKLYDFPLAPNPKKVRVYLAEKGLKMAIEPIDAINGANRTPEFLAKNPLGGLPVLELDDGTCLPESLAIMEYLEELHPEPPMIGREPFERARVRATERICELGVLANVATVFQNTSPFFATRVKQSADAADTGRARLAVNLRVLNDLIGANPFVCGARPTIADCTLFAALEFAAFAGLTVDPPLGNVIRWHAAFRERPSASA